MFELLFELFAGLRHLQEQSKALKNQGELIMASLVDVKAALDAGKVELEADLTRIEASVAAAVKAVEDLKAEVAGTLAQDTIDEINAVKTEAMARVGAAMDSLDKAVAA